MLRWLSILLVALQVFYPGPLPRPGTNSVTFANSQPDQTFGVDVTFTVQLTSSSVVDKVYLSIAPQGRDAVFFPMTLSSLGAATYRLDMASQPLRAFSQISYYYRVTLASGEDVISPTYTFEYTDDRFTWKELENQSFKVFWYDRDVDFGQTALNIAKSGLESASKMVPAGSSTQIRIYIYASMADLQPTRLGAQPWVAGHASPDLHLMMVSIPVGLAQRLELERQIPHEIAHILQYDAFGARAKDLPMWLLEGTASVAELYPNADYASGLQTAVQQNQLLPIASLCADFPRDASGASLAYAQSQSFMRFLYRKYGSNSLLALYEQYHNGLGCSQGIEAAYGVALPELEYRWRLEELGVNPAALIAQNLLPYFILLFVVLGAASLTIIISTRHRKGTARV